MSNPHIIKIPYIEKAVRSDRVCLSCGLNVSQQYGYIAHKHAEYCPECGSPTVILWNNDAPPRCPKCGSHIIDSENHERTCQIYQDVRTR